jgi:hypothetical protein
MKKITEISYDERVHVQTLYQRIRTRGIPVVIDEDGSYAVEEKYIPELLRPGQMGRPRIDKAKEKE